MIKEREFIKKILEIGLQTIFILIIVFCFFIDVKLSDADYLNIWLAIYGGVVNIFTLVSISSHFYAKSEFDEVVTGLIENNIEQEQKFNEEFKNFEDKFKVVSNDMSDLVLQINVLTPLINTYLEIIHGLGVLPKSPFQTEKISYIHDVIKSFDSPTIYSEIFRHVETNSLLVQVDALFASLPINTTKLAGGEKEELAEYLENNYSVVLDRFQNFLIKCVENSRMDVEFYKCVTKFTGSLVSINEYRNNEKNLNIKNFIITTNIINFFNLTSEIHVIDEGSYLTDNIISLLIQIQEQSVKDEVSEITTKTKEFLFEIINRNGNLQSKYSSHIE